MSDSNQRHVKILFDIDGFETVEIESVWAIVVDGGYELDNIPFYARGFALGDVVSAEPDDGGMLRCTGLVRASGHSTVRILFYDKAAGPGVREQLRGMGCETEADSSKLVAVDIPPEVPYARVRSYLEERTATGELEYEEGCLAQNFQG